MGVSIVMGLAKICGLQWILLKMDDLGVPPFQETSIFTDPVDHFKPVALMYISIYDVYRQSWGSAMNFPSKHQMMVNTIINNLAVMIHAPENSWNLQPVEDDFPYNSHYSSDGIHSIHPEEWGYGLWSTQESTTIKISLSNPSRTHLHPLKFTAIPMNHLINESSLNPNPSKSHSYIIHLGNEPSLVFARNGSYRPSQWKLYYLELLGLGLREKIGETMVQWRYSWWYKL